MTLCTLQEEWVPDIIKGDVVKLCYVVNHCLSGYEIQEPYSTAIDREAFLLRHKGSTDRY